MVKAGATDSDVESRLQRARNPACPNLTRRVFSSAAECSRENAACHAKTIPPSRDRAPTGAAIDLLQREIANPDHAMEPRHLRRHRRILARPPMSRYSSQQSDDCRVRGHGARRHRHQAASAQPPLRLGEHHQVRLEPADRALPAGRRLRDEPPDRADRTRRRSAGAARGGPRDPSLFDLGLGALQADFCVRIDDRDTGRATARACSAAPCSSPAIPRWEMILAANPHRVFISQLGRIEVYQPIPPPSGKSPEGPHTPCAAANS